MILRMAGSKAKNGMTSCELADPPFKAAPAHFTDLEAVAAQNAANAELNVAQFALQQFATRQKRPHILQSRKLRTHGAIPTHSQ